VKKLACFQQLQGLKDSFPSLVHPKDSIAQGFKGYNFLSLPLSQEIQIALVTCGFSLFLRYISDLNHSYLSSKLSKD
jgi:hypothetical protein